MSECLNNIVTLGICPDEETSLSGLKLVQAPGISIKNLNNAATETYGTGIAMALEKKELSIIQVRNDLIASLHTNNVPTKISEVKYDSGTYGIPSNLGTYAGERGITLHKNTSIRGKLRKIKINTVSIYSFSSGNYDLKIYDTINGVWSVTTFPIALVANQVNTFDLGYVCHMPPKKPYCRILIDGTSLEVASTALTCCLACSGSLPNDCGHVEGWNGAKVKGQGFGISINFNCFCDYDEILCELAKTYVGELIWLKWRYNIMDEIYQSNRFTDLVVYSHADLPNVMNDIASQYNASYGALMAGLFDILKAYRDDCLDCRGVRYVANT